MEASRLRSLRMANFSRAVTRIVMHGVRGATWQLGTQGDGFETRTQVVTNDNGRMRMWRELTEVYFDVMRALVAYEVLPAEGHPVLAEFVRDVQIVEQRGVPFPVLSDIDGAYALELGLCFYIGDDLMRLFKRMGHQMPVFQGNESWFLPIPATFVLDGEGRIVDRMIDPDFRLNRMAVDRILAALTRIAEAVR